jgi:hypothetical protein
MQSRIGWALFAFTTVIAVAHVSLLIASEQPVFSRAVISDGFPLVTMGAVGGAGVGAVIVSRYPRHRIGWLFVVGQTLSELGLALRAYGHSAVTGELGRAPFGHLSIWVSIQLGGTFVVALLAMLFLLAPNGHVTSPRWRWALGFPVVGLVLNVTAVSTIRPDRFTSNADLAGSPPGPELVAMLLTAQVTVAIGLVLGAVSLMLRLRRALGDERQQLRWMALAAWGLVLGAVSNVMLVVLPGPEWVEALPIQAAYACVPILTGIAILRYRLYEIDVFLNRAIALAVLTGTITVAYIASVVFLGRALPLTHGSLWPSLVASAVVALAFQPARNRAERLADRVVYGARAAPYVELAEFSRRLQESPGLDELLHRVTEAVGHAVVAQQVTIEVRSPGGEARKAEWPSRPTGEPDVVLPLRAEQDDFGRLEVSMPRGVALRADDQRLLSDFAVQLARALRNLRLESALMARIRQVQQRNTELAASSRRLASAQDAERQRFQGNLERDVVPYLHRIRTGLETLYRAPGSGPPPSADDCLSLDDLAIQAHSALEALRALTRGVFPAQLTRRGLVPALASHLDSTRPAAHFDADRSAERRFDPRVESAAYFCAVEFTRELEPPVHVALSADHGWLDLDVSGVAKPSTLARTRHLHDRAAALGASLDRTVDGEQASLRLRIPSSTGSEVSPQPQEASGVEL